jgi:cytochrome P450
LDDIIQLIAAQCTDSKPVDANIVLLPTLNMMWRVTTSTTLTPEQIPLLHRFQKCFSTYLFSKKQNALGPILAHFGLETDLTKRYKAVSAEFRQVQQEIIAEHAKSLAEKTEPDDFVDAYLLKMQDEKSKGSSFEGQLGMRNLNGALMDMNIAGSNTVSHTFQSILLHMIVHPEKQAKLREQVDSVLGPSRTPVLEDRKNLPYVEAFILEVLRDFSPAPFSFHESSQDTKLDGHFIPKDTTVLASLWGANHDEELWEEPMSFKPERFLDSSGEKVQKAELVMSFSAGRHKCPGYLIGQDILFLLTARIAQRFILKEHPEHPITSLEPGMEFFLTAPDFKILFVDRLNIA